MLGMEIREQVTNYVGKRIQAMRQGAEGTPSHHNVSVPRQQTSGTWWLSMAVVGRKNARRRIISHGLLSVYALYHATDVKELHEWMDQACEEHPLFDSTVRATSRSQAEAVGEVRGVQAKVQAEAQGDAARTGYAVASSTATAEGQAQVGAWQAIGGRDP
eukprot:Skav235543  [mRNA]  locus=scaffold3067:217065:221217:+ [translate_table: standard]